MGHWETAATYLKAKGVIDLPARVPGDVEVRGSLAAED
jgi:hypothetical protein